MLGPKVLRKLSWALVWPGLGALSWPEPRTGENPLAVESRRLAPLWNWSP